MPELWWTRWHLDTCYTMRRPGKSHHIWQISWSPRQMDGGEWNRTKPARNDHGLPQGERWKTMKLVVADLQTCLPSYFGRTRLVFLAEAQDRLGWDCMLEGRIPKHFVVHQRAHLAHTKTRMTAKTWTRLLITKQLQITHKQWLLWNTRTHIKRKGDMNEEDHNKLRK